MERCLERGGEDGSEGGMCQEVCVVFIECVCEFHGVMERYEMD